MLFFYLFFILNNNHNLFINVITPLKRISFLKDVTHPSHISAPLQLTFRYESTTFHNPINFSGNNNTRNDKSNDFQNSFFIEYPVALANR